MMLATDGYIFGSFLVMWSSYSNTLDGLLQWVKGILIFHATSTLPCIKGSSPTKRSCIQCKSSCLNGSFAHMQRRVGQHVLETPVGKSIKESNNVANTICTSPRPFQPGDTFNIYNASTNAAPFCLSKHIPSNPTPLLVRSWSFCNVEDQGIRRSLLKAPSSECTRLSKALSPDDWHQNCKAHDSLCTIHIFARQ